ncbi:MAG: nitroreductase [Clostridia bacterium]|nr:nitroreductase [Clostridia bacterium]
MDAMTAILTRRSTRQMRPDVPERELICKVIEAGRYAPSGSNSQSTHFLVITKPDVLDSLAVLVRKAFARMEIGEDAYISLRHSVAASRKGDYVFHYNAPVLIVTANKKGYGNAIADSACALQNMMLAAHAQGLGSCWINQLHWLDEESTIRSFLEPLGLGTDETITGGLILGYRQNSEPAKPLSRTGNPVTWIEE